MFRNLKKSPRLDTEQEGKERQRRAGLRAGSPPTLGFLLPTAGASDHACVESRDRALKAGRPLRRQGGCAGPGWWQGAKWKMEEVGWIESTGGEEVEHPKLSPRALPNMGPGEYRDPGVETQEETRMEHTRSILSDSRLVGIKRTRAQ